MKFITSSLKQTEQLAQMLVKGLKPGTVILANGTLGAGKTAFAKGLGLGLGIKQIINSPTFNIMKVYYGKNLKFYHIDAYRLEDPNAVSDIGFDETLGNEDGISFVEWPNFIPQWYERCEHIISVDIEILSANKRAISIKEVK